MHYMLDTDICSYIIREKPENVLAHYHLLQKSDEEILCISTVSCAELLYGARLKPSMQPHVDLFLSTITVYDWTKEAAYHYADIRLSLRLQGRPIELHDMQIAAHARSLGAAVVTNNVKHFEAVPGILIQNWLQQLYNA